MKSLSLSLSFLACSFALVAGSPACAAEDAHAGHDHAAHGHGHDHGPTTTIGTVKVGTYDVAVAASGTAEAGKAWHLELSLVPAAPLPKAVRVWVGAENGRGSVKAKAEAGKAGSFEAHVEIPAPLPADARIWISVEGEGAPAVTAALAMPGAAPAVKADTADKEHGHKH